MSCWILVKENLLQQAQIKISESDEEYFVQVFVENKEIQRQKYNKNNWVKLKTITCGLCGTDVASYHGYQPFPLPLFIGHEIVAETNDHQYVNRKTTI